MGILRKYDKQGTPPTSREHIATILIIDGQSDNGESYFVKSLKEGSKMVLLRDELEFSVLNYLLSWMRIVNPR